MRLPISGTRIDDKLDVAHMCLDKECANEIHPDFSKLDRDDVPFDRYDSRIEYSAAGYPWRKAKKDGQSVSAPLSSWGGLEATQAHYDRSGFNRKEHIVLRFDRRRMIHLGKLEQQVAPFPDGMSGGGIYAWDDSAFQSSPPHAKLAGIIISLKPMKI